eukprot:11825943-Ditylum_brightwellii.AAC.1
MAASTYRLLCGAVILLAVNSALGIHLSGYADDELHIEHYGYGPGCRICQGQVAASARAIVE